MTDREVVRLVLTGARPPYVPWSMGFTKEAKEKLQRYYGCDDLDVPLQNHLLLPGGCWSWAATADTSSPPRTTLKATFR